MKPTTARSPGRPFRLAAVACACLTARAASAGTPVDTSPSPPPVHASYQTWTQLVVQGKIRGKLILSLDLQGLFYDDMHPSQVLVQPGVGYDFGRGFSALAAYGYTPSWNDAREYVEEHRAWQQLSYKAPFSAVTLIGRARVEERFRPESDATSRLRAMVRLDVPLGLPVPLQTVVWDELFLGFTPSVKWQPEVLDQNWIFLGLGWVFGPRFRVDAGYYGQVLPRRDATTVHHCLSVNATASF